jgi:LDH2 family malate/lactate/ureidoglycolate dehydrogenase
MTDTTIPESELLPLATRALAQGGVRERDAAAAARILVLADLFGLRTHGISRIPQYLSRVPLGGIKAQAEVTVTKPAPALALVDAGNGIGPVAGMAGLDAALDGARSAGIGAAFVRHSNHFGPIMPYAWLAAEQGFATIIASNATTTIAPWGGRDTRLGNNPLGLGVPDPAGNHVILDMALSVAARAKIREHAARGAPIPGDWATDAEGRPTTDAAAALKGFLLPVGGHKGYGLAIMVDLFAGLLAGAAYLTHVKAWDKQPEVAQDLGHVFIAIDGAKLGTPDWLRDRMADFAGIIHATPPADAARPVMLPGEREVALLRRQRADGIRVAAADLTTLRHLAAQGETP